MVSLLELLDKIAGDPFRMMVLDYSVGVEGFSVGDNLHPKAAADQISMVVEGFSVGVEGFSLGVEGFGLLRPAGSWAYVWGLYFSTLTCVGMPLCIFQASRCALKLNLQRALLVCRSPVRLGQVRIRLTFVVSGACSSLGFRV